MDIPATNKLIAKLTASRFGGAPKANRYWDDDRAFCLDVVACTDVPCEGVVSYGTVGLSGYPVQVEDTGRRVATELVGACAKSCEDFSNALVSAAFYTIRNDWRCVPGSILQNALAMYNVSPTMQHLLFVAPFLWSDFSHSVIDERDVHWLMAVPISDAEYQFSKENGVDILEDLFEEKQIDIFDMARPSVL